MLRFDNCFRRELPGDPDACNEVRQVHGAVWSAVQPSPVRAPRLLAHSPEMAAELGLPAGWERRPEWVGALAGNGILPGMEPYASCYGGHQFGQWAGQLGDGRAISLGEVLTDGGRRWELQLKGAGRTPYSRRGDGRAVLRSSLREFLCSEAMHHLGVPTTRALSLVATGEDVWRDMFYDGNPALEPGAVVCRVAPSFIRFGHFELPAFRQDRALLQRLVDFTISRHFPGLQAEAEEPLAAWFREVCARTGRLVARWMQVGFVHGVMNTDNMSILGLTIDYGPYGWVDDFDPGWTPNITDAAGRRYCFGRQPEVARWNLERLAEALALLEPTGALADLLGAYDDAYNAEAARLFAGKFGFAAWQDGDGELVGEVLELLRQGEMDMTEFFRQLAHVDAGGDPLARLQEAAYRPEPWRACRAGLEAWLGRYFQRLGQEAVSPGLRRNRMNAFNPRYVLRNYLAQQAIDKAEAGDLSLMLELQEVLRRPYEEQPGREAFAAMRPDWARHRAGCSMLSCSS
ncbi:YdiU family protein [Azovibrio restrictus]|uniref:protein adenylyltransferase SelO n=1 Tax=Azovibrio restrictus TaxID=146938 RepID=UPI0026EE329E|nr:YdiU family protein [Azovibrio restrictus]